MKSDRPTDTLLQTRHLTRRRLLLGMGASVGAAALAACGGGSSSSSKSSSSTGGSSADITKPVTLSFHYPVAAAGPITKIIESYSADFTKANPNITVTPVYDGDYPTALAKCLQLVQAGTPPDMAIINAAAIYSLTDANAVQPLDDLIKQNGGDAFSGDFFPAFMKNSQLGGKTWSIPFQRSTLVMYYNKDAFKEVGLDPEKPPQTWPDLISYGQKLTKRDASGNVTRWGVGFPSDGTAYWEFQALAIEAGQNVFDNNAGNKVYFNAAQTQKALQFLIDLSKTHKVMPGGTVAWAGLPAEFDAGKYGIAFHTTGSLTSILKGANFQVGVAFNPKDQQFGSPTGGGNFYMFKGLSPERQAASWKFIQFMTSPERQAQWGIDSGYVATRKSAFDTAVLKNYAQQNPQVLVARDQLQYAQNELGTHQMAEVQQILSDAIQAALTGQDSVQGSLDKAQAKADKILSQYKN
jgi:sn-glycerol 3-phosphate transport system substrate-binding protein